MIKSKVTVHCCKTCGQNRPENRDIMGFCKFDDVMETLKREKAGDCPWWCPVAEIDKDFAAEVKRKMEINA